MIKLNTWGQRPTVDLILKLSYIYHYFRTKLTSNNLPDSIPGENLVHLVVKTIVLDQKLSAAEVK